MKKFKEGDRVAVYGFMRKDSELHPYCRGNRGTVTHVSAPDEINVELDTGEESEVHPKQCRRLRAKPKFKPYRVAVYGPVPNIDVLLRGARGTVQWPADTGEAEGVPTFSVLFDDGEEWNVEPRQCRRLVKRSKSQ